MKRLLIILTAILSGFIVFSQDTGLPLKEWNATTDNPFILYISGDGGFNSFSTDLCTTLNKAGYSITALNARSYFWNRKTPGETAGDISGYLQKKILNRKNQQLILLGYSFGSDVMPFIVNQLPLIIKNKLLSVVLLSPSASTDFEVHWLDMFGSPKKRSMDVVAEMNKMGMQKTITIFGSDETDFPVRAIKLKNYNNEVLPGGHHFAGDTDEVAKTLIKYFK